VAGRMIFATVRAPGSSSNGGDRDYHEPPNGPSYKERSQA
jgi:hypothetical protein